MLLIPQKKCNFLIDKLILNILYLLKPASIFVGGRDLRIGSDLRLRGFKDTFCCNFSEKNMHT